jgi:leucyl aminopeptidase
MPLAVTHRVAAAAAVKGPLVILPLATGPLPERLTAFDQACGGTLARCLASGDFTGVKDETALVYPNPGGPERVLLIGMGDAEQVTPAALRRAAMIGGKKARTIGAPTASLLFTSGAAPRVAADRAGQSLAEGVPFGAWHYPDRKRPPESPKPAFTQCELITSEASAEFAAGVARGNAVAAGQTLTRGLQVLPGNTCTPEYIAARAREIGERHGFTVTVMDKAAIIKAGMHALLAVGQGSAVEPRFIILEHRGSTAAPVVFVGKGVTFDTGGISIKPAQNMEDMKYDMSGAAAVLGVFETIGQLMPKQHVIGLIPSCENMPSSTAYKPGDIVSSHLGKTIEVVNTDAEGRLILGDALSWARQYSPAAVIDCATLTGAIVIGLGHTASGLMGTDRGLLDALRTAGDAADERVWELPMWDDYHELIKSDIADMKNSGGRPAGSITAGWFLREFAEGYPWAHIDIAGTAYTDRESPTQVKGPTGVMVRLFAEYLLARV